MLPVRQNSINNFTILLQAMHVELVTILVTVFVTTSMTVAKKQLSQNVVFLVNPFLPRVLTRILKIGVPETNCRKSMSPTI